jgi:hypothetical protein
MKARPPSNPLALSPEVLSAVNTLMIQIKVGARGGGSRALCLFISPPLFGRRIDQNLTHDSTTLLATLINNGSVRNMYVLSAYRPFVQKILTSVCASAVAEKVAPRLGTWKFISAMACPCGS